MAVFCAYKTLCFCIMVVIFLAPFTFAVEFAGGTGEPNDPYKIVTAEQLISIGSDPNLLDKHFVLVSNIDLDPNLPEGRVFPEAVIAPGGVIQVGSFIRPGPPPFSGTFDGNGCVIRNLTIASEGEHAIGLFAALSTRAKVMNLGVENAYIQGNDNVGILAGESAGTVTACYATGRVCGQDSVGGLIGTCHDGQISYSYSAGTVRGCQIAGGLVGRVSGKIICCYSNASVFGQEYVGGFAGLLDCDGCILCSYASGPVDGNEGVGGLVGTGFAEVCQSFWDIESTGQTDSAAGIGRRTDQMMTARTYEGWGYGQQWTIDEGMDYPRLKWEQRPGILIIDDPNRYGGGSGEPNDPYQIWTGKQFCRIARHPADLDRHFVLMADVDLRGLDTNDMRPIGMCGMAFAGSFDGSHYTLSNFTYVSEDENTLGVFRMIGEYNPYGNIGSVRNLHLVDVIISGGYRVGGLAGFCWGTVESCSVTGTVRGTESVGGLVGSNWGNIKSSFAVVEIAAENRGGGLVGWNGHNIYDCYVAGVVAAQKSAGGIVGFTDARGAISRCYATAQVEGREGTGGLVGAGSGPVYLSYWDAEVSGLQESAGGRVKNTTELMTAQTFRGWGYSDVWTIDEGKDYPRLIWEHASGTPIVDLPRTYGGGRGTDDNPYQIWTAEQFVYIAYYPDDLDKSFVLMTDIDLVGIPSEVIVPIGYKHVPFSGCFDGNGHKISNFRCESEHQPYVGVFGRIDDWTGTPVYAPGAVKNLTVLDVNLIGGDYVGGLAGYCSGGEVINCHVVGNITGGNSVGGLIGSGPNAQIHLCGATGSVSGGNNVGGLIGRESGGRITACYADADVTGRYSVGGLIGETFAYVLRECICSGSVLGYEAVGGLLGRCFSPVSSCYSQSHVAGQQIIGGLIGFQRGTVSSCYSIGRVEGDNSVGGLFGQLDLNAQLPTDCFWNIETAGLDRGVGAAESDPPHVVGKTAAEMQTASTFLDAGWDFETIWMICEGKDYPRLRWENVQCEE
jgi:hypothetical protein